MADDTGTDWAALADKYRAAYAAFRSQFPLPDTADDTGTDWAATADALEARANFVDPYALLSDEDLDNMRLAAVGLRRLDQLDTAIEQHRTAHVTEGHPGDEPWSCCNDDFYLWAVLGSGEQPERTEP